MKTIKAYIKYFLIILPAVLSVVSSACMGLIQINTIYGKVMLSILSVMVCYGFTLFIPEAKEHTEKWDTQQLKKIIKYFIIGALVIVLCYLFKNAVLNALYGLFGYVPDEYIDLVSSVTYEEENYSRLEIIAMIIGFAIISPIFEEMFFRHFLIGKFKEIHVCFRLVFSLFCFALSHDDIELIIFIIPMSVICELLYIREGILGAIIIHSMVNIIGILDLKLENLVFNPGYVIKYGEKGTALLFAFFGIVCCAAVFGIITYFIFPIGSRLVSEDSTSNPVLKKRKFHTGLFVVLCIVYCVVLRVFGG